MLEKIININSNQPYKGGKKSKGNFENFISKTYAEKNFGKDSIIFSPAAVYLSRINWLLKDVSYPADEKIVIEFIIDKFDFKTEIDLLTFAAAGYQEYTVIKKGSSLVRKNSSLVKLKVLKSKTQKSDVFNSNGFAGLNTLFNRIENLKIASSFDKNDSYSISYLLDGILDDIFKEFESINNSLLTFISKLGKYDFGKELKFENELEPIIIEKVYSI
ncbi:MAG: hypothetical protein PVH88_01665 [Ignavibacteria bacterium]|jgi:hypothetical protein